MMKKGLLAKNLAGESYSGAVSYIITHATQPKLEIHYSDLTDFGALHPWHISYGGAIGKDLTYQTYIWNAYNFSEVVFSYIIFRFFIFVRNAVSVLMDGANWLVDIHSDMKLF